MATATTAGGKGESSSLSNSETTITMDDQLEVIRELLPVADPPRWGENAIFGVIAATAVTSIALLFLVVRWRRRVRLDNGEEQEQIIRDDVLSCAEGSEQHRMIMFVPPQQVTMSRPCDEQRSWNSNPHRGDVLRPWYRETHQEPDEDTLTNVPRTVASKGGDEQRSFNRKNMGDTRSPPLPPGNGGATRNNLFPQILPILVQNGHLSAMEYIQSYQTTKHTSNTLSNDDDLWSVLCLNRWPNTAYIPKETVKGSPGGYKGLYRRRQCLMLGKRRRRQGRRWGAGQEDDDDSDNSDGESDESGDDSSELSSSNNDPLFQRRRRRRRRRNKLRRRLPPKPRFNPQNVIVLIDVTYQGRTILSEAVSGKEWKLLLQYGTTGKLDIIQRRIDHLKSKFIMPPGGSHGGVVFTIPETTMTTTTTNNNTSPRAGWTVHVQLLNVITGKCCTIIRRNEADGIKLPSTLLAELPSTLLAGAGGSTIASSSSMLQHDDNNPATYTRGVEGCRAGHVYFHGDDITPQFNFCTASTLIHRMKEWHGQFGRTLTGYTFTMRIGLEPAATPVVDDAAIANNDETGIAGSSTAMVRGGVEQSPPSSLLRVRTLVLDAWMGVQGDEPDAYQSKYEETRSGVTLLHLLGELRGWQVDIDDDDDEYEDDGEDGGEEVDDCLWNWT